MSSCKQKEKLSSVSESKVTFGRESNKELDLINGVVLCSENLLCHARLTPNFQFRKEFQTPFYKWLQTNNIWLGLFERLKTLNKSVDSVACFVKPLSFKFTEKLNSDGVIYPVDSVIQP